MDMKTASWITAIILCINAGVILYGKEVYNAWIAGSHKKNIITVGSTTTCQFIINGEERTLEDVREEVEADLAESGITMDLGRCEE